MASHTQRTPARKPKSRKHSMDLPERLKQADDASEDVTALSRNGQARYMNQSIFSMIAAAGSTSKLQSLLDDESSDSDIQPDDEKSLEPSPLPPTTEHSHEEQPVQQRGHKHSSGPSKNKLLDNLKLKTIRERKGGADPNDMTSSQILAPPNSRSTEADDISSEAPILSRRVKAEADMEASEREQAVEKLTNSRTAKPVADRAPALQRKLMEIFRLEGPEEIILETKCWLLQSALLMGYMYITQKHVCFYAYLPKKTAHVAKSGHLFKQGKRSPRYKRLYFELKEDVLSYYETPANKYYPHGSIDLRNAISAAVVDSPDKNGGMSFDLETEGRTYHFKAESAASAREWTKSLQKAIFRSHNDGDAVKISLPIEHIMDIEENPIIDCAETVKIRVIDNDETYAIDEYFFSFFNNAQEALRVLRIMIEGKNVCKTDDDEATPYAVGQGLDSASTSKSSLAQERESRAPARTPTLHTRVRSSSSPPSPVPRGINNSAMNTESPHSSVGNKRRSFEASHASPGSRRRSPGVQRREERSPASPGGHGTPKSISSPKTDSQWPETDSSVAIQSLDEQDASSASQVLKRTDVFQGPTINPTRSVSETSLDKLRRASDDTARSGNHLGSRRRSTSRKARRLLRKQMPSTMKNTVPFRSSAPANSSEQLPSWALQDLVRAGSYPFQRASGLAGYLRDRSKRMGNLLATESMGYYEKVSDMWAGSARHYSVARELAPQDDIRDEDDEKDAAMAAKRFREHFALPESEQLQASYYTWFHRVLPLYGKIYLSNKHLCYRSLLPGTRTKLIVPLEDIEAANKEKGYRLGYCALVVVIKGHEEIFFDFRSPQIRDDCAITLILSMEDARKNLQESTLLTMEEKAAADMAKAEHDALQQASQIESLEHEKLLTRNINESILFDDTRASIINFKPAGSLRVTCLTIGSRGDVQPYIALCKGLLEEGHRPRIATHREFEPWIRKHGIDFAPVEGDPAELMRICVENGMFTYSFLKEAGSKFRGWLDELMLSAWHGCQGSDLLIESPSAMCGIHIAEALQIPYFRAFTMPWTRTRAYPHAFAVPEYKMGGAYNYMSYILIESVFWKAIASQVNGWRKRTLGLGSTTLDKMQPNKVPFLYNFSPHVVVPPLDYSDWIRVTGYWFLDEGKDYTPPSDLADFIKRARDNGKKLVYVGFGSIVVDDPAALTKTVVDAVQNADVRCILSKGWSDRLGSKDASKPEVPLPPEIFQIQAAPHDWLFRQIDAAAHHGGAGTTGASLRAGIPTIVKPFFGDQFFFGTRIEDLGVGYCLKKFNVSVFGKALWMATHSDRVVERARMLGEQIRAEDGVRTAIQCIYRDLEYAKSLIRWRNNPPSARGADDFEETWTFIGDESDPELMKAKYAHYWDPAQEHGGVKERED